MVDVKEALSAVLPKHWLGFFDITEIEELSKEWRIKLVEKETLIPKELEGKIAVLDGYLNSVEIEDFPLRGKATYLKFLRRRWKEKGSSTGFHNNYDFHPEGMKATVEFGSFLKGLNREEADWFSSARKGFGN